MEFSLLIRSTIFFHNNKKSVRYGSKEKTMKRKVIIINFVFLSSIFLSCNRIEKSKKHVNVNSYTVLTDSLLFNDFTYDKLVNKENFIKKDVVFLNGELNKDYENYTKSTYLLDEYKLKFENLSYSKKEVRNVYYDNFKLDKKISLFGDSIKFNFDNMLPYTYDETTNFYISKDSNYYLIVDIPDNSAGRFTERYNFYQLIDKSKKVVYEFYLYDAKSY